MASTKKPIKTKKEIFEEQLRALQEDITTLSQNLSTHKQVTPANFNDNTSLNNGKSSSSLDKQNGQPLDTKQQHENGNKKMGSEEISHLKHEIAQLKHSLLILQREKDDLVFRDQVLQKEVYEYRASMDDVNKFRVMFEHLKQENESLKISLESSERIRVQQKELIFLLQKSHSIGDSASVVSVGSLSTIQSKDSASLASLTPSVAAENRSWLNTFNPMTEGPKTLTKDVHVPIISNELINEVSKQKSNPSDEVSRNGIAERSEPKATKESLARKLDMTSTSIYTANDSLPPIPGIPSSMRSESIPTINADPSPDFTAYLNYQYLNFTRSNQGESPHPSAPTNNNGSQSQKPPKRKPVTKAKNMTTAPRSTPQRTPMASIGAVLNSNSKTPTTRARGGSHDSIYQTLIALQKAGAFKPPTGIGINSTPGSNIGIGNGRRLSNASAPKPVTSSKGGKISSTPTSSKPSSSASTWKDPRRPLSAPPGSSHAHRFNSNEVPIKSTSTFGSGRGNHAR